MSNRIIKLNIGGKKFETLEFIPYFKSMFSNNWTEQNQEEIFIDRSGKQFEHILSLARNPFYRYPKHYKEELEFLGFSTDNVNFYSFKGSQGPI